VHHATLPAPGGEAELHEWLGDFWSHRLDRHRPLWQLTLLDGLAGGRWALVTKTHHCLVDGVGSIDIGHVLLDTEADAAPPPPAPLPEGDGDADAQGGRFWLSPGLVARGARAGLGSALHPRESLHRVRAAVELVIREEVIGAPRSSLNGPMSGTREFATVRFSLKDVKAVKNRLGGTVNDVVLALCAGGLRHLLVSRGDELPDRGLRAQVPVNIRSEAKEHALGNELTSLFVELPVSEPDAMARYRSVVQRAEELKAGSQRTGGKTIVDVADMGPPLAGELLAWSMFGGTRMFNLTITNVPGPKQRFYAFGAPLAEVLPLVPLFAGHSIGIAVVSYAGQVVFGLNADRMSASDVGVLADGIERSFAELRKRRATGKPRQAAAQTGSGA
jgi:WS/DGAT/MGAT family acyltransferase